MNNLPIAEYPGLIATNEPPPAVGRAALGADRDSRRAVFSGDLAAVQEHYLSRGWTDGLAITPPTRGLVQALLDQTDRGADTK